VLPSILVGIVSGASAEQGAAEGLRSASSGLAAFLGNPAALGICLLASLALFALSFLYSTRRYLKKEF
jgi:TctA family transporter